jgi:T-complex protein 1 subunit beta
MATDCAREALEQSASNNSKDLTQFKTDLLNIARTTLSSKILSQHKELFAQLAVDAVLRLKGSCNLDAIQIIKKLGGNLADSYLDEGTIISQPRLILNRTYFNA